MPVIVGVDAGGTATRALAERDGVEGTVVVEHGANVRGIGVDAAAQTVGRAIAGALDGAAAGAVHVGIAGGGNSATQRSLALALAQQFPGARVSVSDDTTIALRAGAPHGDALVLVAGTGSIACALIGDTAYRAGGFGHLIGDEGSGRALGAAALNAALRSYDGRIPREPLFDRIAETLDANDTQSLLDRIYDDPQPVRALAALAPLVLAAATAGERTATKIVQAAALELFELVRSVARSADIGKRELPLVLAGGVFAQNSLLTYLLETRLSNEFPYLTLVKAPPAPVAGALALARAAIGR